MKRAYAIILVVALPLSLAAQQTPAGPPANPVTTVFRGRTMTLQRNLVRFHSRGEVQLQANAGAAHHRLHRTASGERQLSLLQQFWIDEGHATRGGHHHR